MDHRGFSYLTFDIWMMMIIITTIILFVVYWFSYSFVDKKLPSPPKNEESVCVCVCVCVWGGGGGGGGLSSGSPVCSILVSMMDMMTWYIINVSFKCHLMILSDIFVWISSNYALSNCMNICYVYTYPVTRECKSKEFQGLRTVTLFSFVMWYNV